MFCIQRGVYAILDGNVMTFLFSSFVLQRKGCSDFSVFLRLRIVVVAAFYNVTGATASSDLNAAQGAYHSGACTLSCGCTTRWAPGVCSSVRLVCLYFYLSVCLFCLSACLPVCLVCLSACLSSVCLSVCTPAVCLRVCLLPICLPACLCLYTCCLSVCLVCMHVCCLSAFISV